MDTEIVTTTEAERQFTSAVHNLRRHDLPKLIELAKAAHIRGTMKAYEWLKAWADEGRYLEGIRSRMTAPQWLAWLNSENYWKSQASAYRYIALAKKFAMLPKDTAMGLREALEFGAPKEVTFDDLDEDITAPALAAPKAPTPRPADPLGQLRRRLKKAVEACWEAENEVGVDGVVLEHQAKLHEFLQIINGNDTPLDADDIG